MNNELASLSNEELLELYKEENAFVKYLEDLHKKAKEDLEAQNE